MSESLLKSSGFCSENEREVTWPVLMAAAPATRDRRRRRNHDKFLQIMARHPEICCVFLAIVFTILSNYSKSNGTPQFAHQPGPKRYFTPPGSVLDFPMGNLVEVGDLLLDEEVLMVMYYAPWCHHCARAKREFEKAASYLENQVQFVGINCWYPLGACRRQNNFSTYPSFFLYHTTLDGFRYTGVLRADYLVRFVEQIMYPVTPIHFHNDLLGFVATTDNAVIGHFDFNVSPQPPGYQQFYYAAMRTLELDPRNPVDFGVITNPVLAKSFDMDTTGTVFLLRSLNDTLKYPPSRNFTCSGLVQWVMTLRQQPAVRWLLPTESKSLALSTELNKGPALILFTPSVPLASVHQHQAMLREVVLDYKNCNQSGRRQDLAQTSLMYRYASHIFHLDLLEQCKKLRQKTPASDQRPMRALPTKRCCASALFGDVHKLNSCDVCLNYDFDHPMSAKDCMVLSLQTMPAFRTFKSLVSFDAHSCAELMPTYNPGEFVSFCCDNVTARRTVAHSFYKPLTSGFNARPADPYIDSHTSSNLVENECQKIRHQRLNGWLPGAHAADLSFEIVGTTNFTGLGCDTNKSVNFYAMDVKQSGLFARNLGLDVASHNQTVIVLIDKQNEVHYVLEDAITKANVARFVESYMENTLGRHLRSTSARSEAECVGSDHDICIHELATSTFHDVVMDPEKDVVLMYYAPWCGFCASFAHIYLALAKYFKTAKTILFARINTDRHDLPWEFSADVYPTITLFPALRKADSVTFPDHVQKTLPNLVQFVLHHASRSLKMDTGFSVCSRSCIQSNMHSTAERIHVLHKEIYDTEQRIKKVQWRSDPGRSDPASGRIDAVAGPIHPAAGRIDPAAGRINPAAGRIDPAAGRIDPADDAATSGSFFERTGLLSSYLSTLRRRLKLKDIERLLVKGLHNTLLETPGFYIEKHKLSSLLSLSDALRATLGGDDKEDMTSEEDAGKSSQGHDEL